MQVYHLEIYILLYICIGRCALIMLSVSMFGSRLLYYNILFYIYTLHRTNPKANVKLSGKKKRILLKEAKRLIAKKKQMEGEWDSLGDAYSENNTHTHTHTHTHTQWQLKVRVIQWSQYRVKKSRKNKKPAWTHHKLWIIILLYNACI